MTNYNLSPITSFLLFLSLLFVLFLSLLGLFLICGGDDGNVNCFAQQHEKVHVLHVHNLHVAPLLYSAPPVYQSPNSIRSC